MVILIYFIGLAIGLAYAGYHHESGGWMMWDEQLPIIIISLIWPVSLAALIIFGIACVPVKLGRFVARMVNRG